MLSPISPISTNVHDHPPQDNTKPTARSSLTKRVRSPDKDDWEKLKGMLGYLKGKFHMRLRIKVNSMSQLCLYVDASYKAHMDEKGHTGMMMNL